MTTTPDNASSNLPGKPPVVDLATWQTAREELLAREKAHTREGDAIAAAQRRLPMVELDGAVEVTGADGPVPFVDLFQGRDELVVYQRCTARAQHPRRDRRPEQSASAEQRLQRAVAFRAAAEMDRERVVRDAAHPHPEQRDDRRRDQHAQHRLVDDQAHAGPHARLRLGAAPDPERAADRDDERSGHEEAHRVDREQLRRRAPAPRSRPPRSGPSRYEAEDVPATERVRTREQLFGHEVRHRRADEDSNGLVTTADSPKSRLSASAESIVSAITAATTAAARSERTITRRRSNRSPIQPAAGARTTEAKTAKNSATETQSADPVSL